MAEALGGVDTSSYPRAAIPTSPLDIAGKLGGLQSQKLDIDQKKLDQANQALTYLTRGLNSLGPNATKDQLINVGKSVVSQGLAPPAMLEQMIKDIPNDPNQMPAFIDRLRTQTATHQEMINHFLGQPSSINTGQRTDILRLPGSPNQPVRPLASIPTEVPPTASVLGPKNAPQLLGNQPAPPAQGFTRPGFGLPAAPNALPARPNVNAGPPLVDNKDQAQVPRGPVTGLPPGESTLMEAGATHLAQDRVREAAFQRDVFPLAQAIPALETLGTKGTGPGTETINHLKSFVLSNVPGIKESDFNGTVADYDKAKKYLTDFVNQTGNSGTNDKLAAAFAGSPSVGISNAATVDVAKSALALRRMQNAMYLEFETQKLPASDYSKWRAQQTQKTDPRAFGVDMMSKSKLDALKRSFKTQREADQFEESLNLAKNMGFLNPSSK